MKGISLIKIEFKGYALEFKKKMILQEMRIKKGLKTTKTQIKANRFSLIFLDCVPIEN
ncbi:hypothetical protein HpDR126_14620 [Helicobacter pylori]